jgi:hypothetical protein
LPIGAFGHAVDFESTTSANSITPARYIFTSDILLPVREIGGTFRRDIENQLRYSVAKDLVPSRFLPIGAFGHAVDFESTTSANSITPA